MRSICIFLFACFLLGLAGCNKGNDGESYHPVVDSSLNGVIYYEAADSINALTIDPAAMKFRSKVYGSDGSYYTFMNYDSGYIYKGTGVYNMVCYNAATGNWLWHYTFGPPFSGSGGGAVSTQKMIFADSTMLFVQDFPTVGMYLYCLNKKTGRLIWRQKTFLGGGTASPYQPLIDGDKVFLPGTNTSDAEVIRCYNRITGQKLWEYANTGAWTREMELYNGTLICWGNPRAICLNETDGTLRWQTPSPAASGVLWSDDHLPAGSRTLWVRSLNSSSSCYWINKSDGTVGSNSAFPREYTYCEFKDNKLIFLYAQAADTAVSLKAYDAQTFAELWTCKLPKFAAVLFTYNVTPMVIVDDKIIFAENAGTFPNKTKFNFIDLATGRFDKAIIPTVGGITEYFAVVKQNKVYTAHY